MRRATFGLTNVGSEFAYGNNQVNCLSVLRHAQTVIDILSFSVVNSDHVS